MDQPRLVPFSLQTRARRRLTRVLKIQTFVYSKGPLKCVVLSWQVSGQKRAKRKRKALFAEGDESEDVDSEQEEAAHRPGPSPTTLFAILVSPMCFE